MALLSGLGGGSILSAYLKREQNRVLETKVEALSQLVVEANIPRMDKP
jgi:hypothetical protein